MRTLRSILIKVRTGPLPSTNQVSATKANTTSLSQSYQNKGCWPGYHPSQSAEWWVWEMGCCSNPEREREKSRDSMPLIPRSEDMSFRVRSKRMLEYCNLSSHWLSWLELAQTPYYSCIHCPPCLAMGTVRQGLQVCPPGNTSSPSAPIIFSNL